VPEEVYDERPLEIEQSELGANEIKGRGGGNFIDYSMRLEKKDNSCSGAT